MNSRRSIGIGMVAVITLAGVRSQVPEVVLTRPGLIVVSEITGDVSTVHSGQRRIPKVEDRVRVDSAVTTGRRSLVMLAFSNGAMVELGPESELEVEELLQAPFAGSAKTSAMKAEPSVSRTRLRLVRGEVRLVVKPLNVSRGSAFLLAMPAGIARVDDGALHAQVRMTDVGLGMCAIELERGSAEFEPVGATFAKVPAGRRLALAVEIDRSTGAVKIGEMPKDAPPAKE